MKITPFVHGAGIGGLITAALFTEYLPSAGFYALIAALMIADGIRALAADYRRAA